MIDAPHVRLGSSRIVRRPIVVAAGGFGRDDFRRGPDDPGRVRDQRAVRHPAVAEHADRTAAPRLRGWLDGFGARPAWAPEGAMGDHALVRVRKPSHRARGDLDHRVGDRPIAPGVASPRGAHARSRRRQLRAGTIGDRRCHRHARDHHVRQRQVLRDLEVLARGAPRSRSSDPELRATTRRR